MAILLGGTSMRVHKSLIAMLTAIAITSSVFAQVSPQLPARDSATSITVEGKITKMEFATPYVTLYVDATALDSGRLVYGPSKPED
jgi:hypothetical protein